MSSITLSIAPVRGSRGSSCAESACGDLAEPVEVSCAELVEVSATQLQSGGNLWYKQLTIAA